jgi:hypothetical protein
MVKELSEDEYELEDEYEVITEVKGGEQTFQEQEKTTRMEPTTACMSGNVCENLNILG